MSEHRESWHLSKSVPVTLIFALAVQAGAIIWAASAGFQNIEMNNRRIIAAEVRLSSLETTVQNQEILLARIDENLKVIREAIEKLAESQ